MGREWVQYFAPETKEKLKLWLPVGSAPGRKTKADASAKNTTLLAFFDAQVVIYRTCAEDRINARVCIGIMIN